MTTDEAARKGAGIPLENVTHIPAPYMFPELDTIQYMETLLEDDHSGVETPAALVVEAVQAEGGIYVLPTEWLQRARAFCDKYGILMILDEIQVGNCRTGTFFAFERAGISAGHRHHGQVHRRHGNALRPDPVPARAGF
mgnify:CR=1 FL=1